MELQSKEEIKSLVDKTIANHKTMIAAMKRLVTPPPFQKDIDKQRDYTESSMHRCRRCGDSVVPFLPTAELSMICIPCQTELRKRDAPMWFVEILDKTRPQKNVTKAVDTLPDEDKMIYDSEIKEGKHND